MSTSLGHTALSSSSLNPRLARPGAAEHVAPALGSHFATRAGKGPQVPKLDTQRTPPCSAAILPVVFNLQMFGPF